HPSGEHLQKVLQHLLSPLTTLFSGVLRSFRTFLRFPRFGWDETFSFGVPFAELPARRLHFSVYDFDRFSRHDLIGQVVLDNLLEAAEARPEVPIWRDIQEGTGVSGHCSWGTSKRS
uniref:C2 domain-containing protein n=1 Tax=Cyanistes caeruleus TaxID=156563 RepID=A0A8C0TVD6_CYACU